MTTNKIFFCYSSSDRSIAELIVDDLSKEKIKLELCIDGFSIDDFDEKVSSQIENSDIFLFLVSDNLQTDTLSKMCIDYACNMNKNIIPISYQKNGWFSGNSWINKQWNIRRDVFYFLNIDSKAELYALMRDLLGVDSEPGDRIGKVVTITTTSNGSLFRDGKLLTKLTVGQPCSIRLCKRSHHLTVIGNIYDNELTLTYDVEIDKNIGKSNWTIDLKQEEYNKHLEYVEKEKHRQKRISELKNDLRYAEISYSKSKEAYNVACKPFEKKKWAPNNLLIIGVSVLLGLMTGFISGFFIAGIGYWRSNANHKNDEERRYNKWVQNRASAQNIMDNEKNNLYTIQSEIKKLESISYVDSKYLLE